MDEKFVLKPIRLTDASQLTSANMCIAGGRCNGKTASTRKMIEHFMTDEKEK